MGKEDEEDKAQLGVSDEGGALLLVAVCSQTGYLLALPLKSKGQLALITHELLAFTQILGHEGAVLFRQRAYFEASAQTPSPIEVCIWAEDDHEDYSDLRCSWEQFG